MDLVGFYKYHCLARYFLVARKAGDNLDLYSLLRCNNKSGQPVDDEVDDDVDVEVGAEVSPVVGVRGGELIFDIFSEYGIPFAFEINCFMSIVA